MEPTAFATEELALHGVAHELVAEAERGRLLLDQEAAVDQRPEVGDQLVLGPVTERRQDVEARPGAEHRGGLDDAALVGRQPVELAADELVERPRQGPVGERLRIGVAGGAEDLLEEERVAAGAPQQRLGHPRARRAAGDRSDERGDLVPVEPIEVDLVDVPAPLEADEHLAAREPRREVVGTVRRDQRERRQRHAGDLFEHGDAVGVGPVQVLEEEQGRAAGDPRQDLVGGGDPAVTARRRGHLAEHRPDAVERATERAGLGVGR